MVHAINEGGGGAMWFVGVRSRAVARGSGGMPPGKIYGFSETHSGAFSAEYNDGKIVHQNPLVSS